MDYSSMHDDHAVGSSPWGNSPGSSPRQARVFGSSVDDDDYRATDHGQTPFASGFEHDGGSEITAVDHGSGMDGSGLTNANEADASQEDFPPETPVKSQDQQRAAVLGHQQEQQQEQQQQPQPQQQHHGQGEGQRQQQKPPASPFRLLAKITGLERTGKKDPILRFDVHVCGGLGLGSSKYLNHQIANAD
jgi:hypothetical protein